MLRRRQLNPNKSTVATNLYNAAETALVLTEFELRLPQATCMAWATEHQCQAQWQDSM